MYHFLSHLRLFPTQQRELRSIDKPGQHPHELNPFWKEGGSGLPDENHASDKMSKSAVGDGGRNWILRSYKRALEQAEAENKSLEEIAIKRWGSLEKLHALLQSAGIDPSNPDHSTSKKYLYSSHSTDHQSKDEDGNRSHHDSQRMDDHVGKKRSHHVSHRKDDHEDRKRSHHDSHRRDDHKEKRNHSHSSDDQGDRNMSRHDSNHRSGRRLESKGIFLKPGEGNSKPTVKYEKESQNWRIPSNTDEKVTPRRELSQTATNSTGSETKDTLISLECSPQPITDAQLNTLGAKLVKAEMMGDTEKIDKLKHELDKLRKLKESQDSRGSKVEEEKKVEVRETVVLTTTDRFGRERPFEFPSRISRPSSGAQKSSHSKKGRREKYFVDDDRYSLQDLVEQERKVTAEETHAAIARMASKFAPATNSNEVVDDVLDSKLSLSVNEAKEQEKQKHRAMLESRAMTEILSKCQFCFDTPNFNKNLLIAVGIGVYLAVPSHQSITEGHCWLVPVEHTTCALQMDENVWSEIQIFQKGLTRMFADRDMDVIFTEMYSHSKRKSHMYIECIPLPKDEGSLAPMYFKKAILESDEEWSQNKKLIDTRGKGVRSSVPAGLPYFFVDFGMGGGYAHIIEDTAKFPHYFAKEVIGGLLDVEPCLWLKPPKENFENQKSKACKFSDWWGPYDWTHKLKN